MTNIFWIDLFAGSGGTTTGIHLSGNGRVIACINHDKIAIESHKANHPDCLHFTEDIRTFDVKHLVALVELYRKNYPGCVINLWASLECTNFSKAKGGLPRNGDSRTLAIDLYRYIAPIAPDSIYIENVQEFMAWGPMKQVAKRFDDKIKYKFIKRDQPCRTQWRVKKYEGNESHYDRLGLKPWEAPVSRDKGRDYLRWVEHIKGMGYTYDYRLLNAADYGAYTSRIRYFGQFAVKGAKIMWPEPTHCKNPSPNQNLFSTKLEKWKAVRDVLDLWDEGQSIFAREKPLVDKTLERIYAGLVKFVANGEDHFVHQPMGGNPNYKVYTTDRPFRVVTGSDHQSIVKTQFIQKHFSGRPKGKVKSIEEPAGTVTTAGNQSLVTSSFLAAYYGTGKNVHSIEHPSPTVRTKDGIKKISYIMMNYSSGQKVRSIQGPAASVVGNDKHRFITVQHGKSNAKSMDEPCGSVTTKDKYSVCTNQFFTLQYGQSKAISIDQPASSIPANDKHHLISPKWIMDTNFNNVGFSLDNPSNPILACRKHHYLLNPQWFNKAVAGIDNPCFTLIARMDKTPPYKVTATEGYGAIIVYDDDSDIMIKIKEFMATYCIVDIKMRMLNIQELLRIQGFPEDYKLKGTKTQQKKMIGNAVECNLAKALASSNYNSVTQNIQVIA